MKCSQSEVAPPVFYMLSLIYLFINWANAQLLGPMHAKFLADVILVG